MSKLLIFILTLAPLAHADAPTTMPKDRWMAIVGDSSVTGAAASAEFSANWWNLLTQMVKFAWSSERTTIPALYSAYPSPEEFNITDPVEALTRVMYSKSEYAAAAANNELSRIEFEADVSVRLDTPKYAFGYMVGRALNVAPAQIVNTGQDGKRVNSMAQQFERIFEVGRSTLPPLILVSFVANDFCHPINFTRPVVEFRAEYERDLRAEFSKIQSLPPAADGTMILFLAPLDVAGLLTNPELLAQKINFQQNENVTCGDLRAGAADENGPLARAMTRMLVGECRGVLAPSADPEAHIQRIRDLQAAQVDVLNKSIRGFNRAARSGLRARLARSVREIDFKSGDLAGDCFHPGVGGHTRIARQLLSHELKSWKK